jgi:hypothetical protein
MLCVLALILRKHELARLHDRLWAKSTRTQEVLTMRRQVNPNVAPCELHRLRGRKLQPDRWWLSAETPC